MIELDSDNALGYSGMARFFYYLSNYEQAIAYSLEAQKRDLGNVNYLNRLAYLYLELGELELAEDIRDRMVDLDVNSTSASFVKLEINLHRNNTAGAHETINWLLPRLTYNLLGSMSLGATELTLGNKARAREIYLSTVPGWMDSDRWQELVELYEIHGCIVSWILINTGDADLGLQLLEKSTKYIDETLPAIDIDVDRFALEICYLTAGDKENALQAIETQLAHNHLNEWEIGHRLPMYDLIREEPRYQAALRERERIVSAQREAIDFENPFVD